MQIYLKTTLIISCFIMGATMGKNGNFLDALPSQSTMHVVMLGLDSAGKTTALYRLKFDQYLNTVPTIGFNCEKIQGTIGKAKGVQFLVWDVGGQEKLRPLWRSYTRCTDGILFVVDSVDVERMEEAKMELMRTAKCPDNQGVPVLILANKQDLPNARDPKELEKLLGLQELQYPAMNFASMHSTTSSSTGNIAGCSNSSSHHQSGNTHKRCLTPTSQHQKSFELGAGANYVSSSDMTISSSTSLLTQTNSISSDDKASKEALFRVDIAASASLASTPTAASAPNNTTFLTKKHGNATSTLQFKGWYIQPACAITGEGLQEGLEALHDMILKRRKLNKAYKKKR